MGLSPYGCERMVAELLLSHQTACMLPRSISGVLGDSGGLCGPRTLGEKMGSWRRLGIRTPYAPYGGGVLLREGDQKLFSCNSFEAYPPQYVSPQPWASQNHVS